MQIKELPSFKKAVKKLHKNQKDDLYIAIRAIMENPNIGKLKTGDLADIQVYKFNMQNQWTLLAYQFNESQIILTLLYLGSHQNFYDNLKKKIKK